MTYNNTYLFVLKFFALCLILYVGLNKEVKAQSSCIPSFYNLSDPGVPSCISTGSVTRFERNQRWKVTYPGDSLGSEIGTGDIGQCILNTSGYLKCEPDVDFPTASSLSWKQRWVGKYVTTDNQGYNICGNFSATIYTQPPRRCTACGNAAGIRCSGGGTGCLSGLTTSGEVLKEGDSTDLCSPCNPDQWELDACWQSGGVYDYGSCQCGQSPIVIDVLGNGFNLTNAQNGVNFDINGDGIQDRIAWSSANSDDAWLALDRNDNGTIDSGKELFGNSTQQPAPPTGEMKNGFLALAEFDKIANGGNADGKINRLDAVFANLRLWQDLNHNGVSEANELKTLTELGLARIDLDYRESRRTDEFGNRFRYRAKIRDTQDAQLGRWAWDVYLVVRPPNN